MSKTIKNIVIVGGGTAGWITAGIIAAEHIIPESNESLNVTLIESPNIPTIGVGEGTWPSMKETLKTIGVSESDFLTQCDASFKQGSQFLGWKDGGAEHYYHPFTLPEQFHHVNLANHWLMVQDQVSFDKAVSFQAAICEQGLAPKQITTPEFSFVGNYGYHLDAGKFSEFLKQHCVNTLNVQYIQADVTQVQTNSDGDVTCVVTEQAGEIFGDLFVDCTGTKGLLINETLKVPFVSRKSVLFNDAALAVQVPYADGQDIKSATQSTAQKNGWIWDIGLQSRRGVGHVYSTAHYSDECAEQTLLRYVEQTSPGIDINSLTIRKLNIEPGHREKFWCKNVVAVGMSAGFIEPLEASAIALIELSAKFIAAQLPKNREMLDIIAERFNRKFLERWDQIIDFLKLHYILSNRKDSQYWIDATSTDNIPNELKQKLLLWQYQPPYSYDAKATEELFPAASYQYIYYGMGGQTQAVLNAKQIKERQMVQAIWHDNAKKTNQLLNILPKNRDILEKIKTFGLTKV